MNSHRFPLVKANAIAALLFLVVFGIPIASFAQSGWVARQSNTRNGLLAIDYYPHDPSILVAVGSNYVIRRSTDGGQTWHEGFDPQYIFDVAATDTGSSAVFVAVGAGGRILRSINNASAWGSRTSPTTRRLNDVDFPIPTVGYAVGELGTVIKTTDAGLTWFSGGVVSPFTLNGVSFANADTGIVVGANGTIFRTTTGGGTWIAQNSGTPHKLNGVDHFPTDPQEITVVGDSGMIFSTTNGGLTWIGGGSPDPGALARITFFDNNRAAIVGEGGKIYLTTNGGTTWLPQTTGVVSALHGVAYYPTEPGDLTAVGADGLILQTINGGATWAQRTSYTNNVLRGIAMTRTARVAAGAGDNIRRSTNGGASWSITTTGYTLRDVSIVPGTQEVWAVGDRSTVSSSTVFHSSDAGVNWMTKAWSGSEDFYAVRFVNSQYGYIGSSTLGRVYRTTDSGASWANTSTPPPMVRVFDFAFASPDSGHAVGSGGLNGKISFTTNAGTNWSTQAQTGIPSLRAIDFYPSDPTIRTVVGDSGFILQTTNFGATWAPRGSGTTRDLEGVARASQSHIYAVGDLGTIVRSTDGGAIWSQQPSGVTNTLYDVAFISRDTGFVVGNSGLILATTTGGVVAVPEEVGSAVPRAYVLMQNYPNPFNPTTSIRYEIADQSNVELIVFNTIGQKVATLVNRTQSPGEYSVRWDATDMPSGIYFYRLRARPLEGSGLHTETKKLVLLK